MFPLGPLLASEERISIVSWSRGEVSAGVEEYSVPSKKKKKKKKDWVRCRVQAARQLEQFVPWLHGGASRRLTLETFRARWCVGGVLCALVGPPQASSVMDLVLDVRISQSWPATVQQC